MITPLDIQNKEFAKSVNGYKKDDVDEFLDLLTVDMEKVLSENATLKAENTRMSTELQKYKGSEGAVLETLEAAKALMGDISASAEKRAEILLKNAELDAELITREARESIERLTEESLLLKNRFTVFQSKYRNLLEMELERFDTLGAEIFAEFGIEEDFPDSEKIPEITVQETKQEAKAQTTQATAKTVILSSSDMTDKADKEDLSQTLVNIRTGDGA